MAATPLALDATFPAGVRFEEPVDVYGFEATAGQAVRVEIPGSGEDSLELPPDSRPPASPFPTLAMGSCPCRSAADMCWESPPATICPKSSARDCRPTSSPYEGVAVSSLEAGTPVSGTLVDGSAGVWTFDGTADQVVSVAVDAPTTTPVLRLVAHGGETLARKSIGWASWQSRQLVAQLPTDGRYLVDIRGDADEPEAAYRLTVRAGRRDTGAARAGQARRPASSSSPGSTSGSSMAWPVRP